MLKRSRHLPEKQPQCPFLLKYPIKEAAFFFPKTNDISIGTKKRNVTFLTPLFNHPFPALGRDQLPHILIHT
jgi:hypothetical protein